MKLRAKNRHWASAIELTVMFLIMPLLLLSFSQITISAISQFKKSQLYAWVYKNNALFLKALAGTRFANGVEFIDSDPSWGSVILSIPWDKTIKFLWTKGSALKKDVNFINESWMEVFTYEKGLYYFNRFEPVEMDSTVNRGWVRYTIKFWTDGKSNELAARKFWINNSFFLTYSVLYTFRNIKQ